MDNCPSNCYGNGDCISGTCHCFLGFLGPDCGRGETGASACDPYSPGPMGGSRPTSQSKRRTLGHLLPPMRRAPQTPSLEAPRGGGSLMAELWLHQSHCAQGCDRGGSGQPRQTPCLWRGQGKWQWWSFEKVDFPFEECSAFAKWLWRPFYGRGGVGLFHFVSLIIDV